MLTCNECHSTRWIFSVHPSDVLPTAAIPVTCAHGHPLVDSLPADDSWFELHPV